MKNEDKKLWDEFCVKAVSSCPEEMTLAAYIDGKLPENEKDSLESHISACDECLEIVSQLRMSDAAVGKAGYTELNESIFNKVFKPAMPFNSYRHMKVAALAASFIILFSVVMVITSSNKAKPVTDVKIARTIELYNNNKFYKVSKETVDGFAPAEFYCIETISKRHEADLDSNGRISMKELLQYIAENNPQPTNHVAGN